MVSYLIGGVNIKYKSKQKIGLFLMILGILVEIFALIDNIEYWNLATLLFLIGLVISDLSAHQYLRKFKKRYGDLE